MGSSDWTFCSRTKLNSIPGVVGHVGLDVAHATMTDYANQVLAAVGDQPAVLCGWSMGGLVALMAARHCRPTTHSLPHKQAATSFTQPLRRPGHAGLSPPSETTATINDR